MIGIFSLRKYVTVLGNPSSICKKHSVCQEIMRTLVQRDELGAVDQICTMCPACTKADHSIL